MKALRAQRPELRLKLSEGLLERRRSTRSQAGLSPHQRRVNLRGVFFAPLPEQRAGRHVLLIDDDIYTTGATARACSQVLRRAGAAAVWVATVASPQQENFRAPRLEELPMEENITFCGDTPNQLEEAAAVPQSMQGKSTDLAAASRKPGSHQSKKFWGKNVFGQSDDPRA